MDYYLAHVINSPVVCHAKAYGTTTAWPPTMGFNFFMDIRKYLRRIQFTDRVVIDDKTLFGLHEHHVFNVPFENLDVHYRRLFGLDIERIYEKVVVDLRGGFCYELNTIFNALLRQIGFNSWIIAARVIDDARVLGPEYDHMAICIEWKNKRYLADVGYGDLFTRPLQIKDGIQSDGRNRFKVEKLNEYDFVVLMSSDNLNLQQKYRFNLIEVPVEEFTRICLDKQTSPSSYFVKNVICTKATSLGRLTIFNDKLIEKKGNERIERSIRNDAELRSELRSNFGVVIR